MKVQIKILATLLMLCLPWTMAVAEASEDTLTGCETYPKSEADIKAFSIQKELATKGDALEQSKLAEMYLYGKGVKHDYQQAEEWYRKSAAQGEISAYFGLGEIYRYGYGDVEKKDVVEAVEWYIKSAEKGHLPSQEALEQIYEAHILFGSEDIRIYSQISDEELIKNFALTINEIKQVRAGAVSPKAKQMADKYRQLANQGEAWAQYILGQLYAEYHGGRIGVVVNKDESLKWFRKAAENGHLEAQMYFLEKYKSLEWLRRSAKRGNLISQKEMDFVENLKIPDEWSMRMEEINNKTEVIGDLREKKPLSEMKLGDIRGTIYYGDAVYQIPFMFEKGIVVEQDYRQAYIWYLKIIKNLITDGDSRNREIVLKAKQGISRLEQYLTAEEIQSAKDEFNQTKLKTATSAQCGRDDFSQFLTTFIYNEAVQQQHVKCPVQYSQLIPNWADFRIIEETLTLSKRYTLSELKESHLRVHSTYLTIIFPENKDYVIVNKRKEDTGWSVNYIFQHDDKCWYFFRVINHST